MRKIRTDERYPSRRRMKKCRPKPSRRGVRLLHCISRWKHVVLSVKLRVRVPEKRMPLNALRLVFFCCPRNWSAQAALGDCQPCRLVCHTHSSISLYRRQSRTRLCMQARRNRNRCMGRGIVCVDIHRERKKEALNYQHVEQAPVACFGRQTWFSTMWVNCVLHALGFKQLVYQFEFFCYLCDDSHVEFYFDLWCSYLVEIEWSDEKELVRIRWV